MGKDNIYYLAQRKYQERPYHKKEFKQKWQGKNRFLLIFTIVISMLSLIALYYLFHNQKILVLARYDEVVDGFKTEGLLVRDEVVYYSPLSGFVKLKQSEGERVSYGQGIIDINNTTLYNNRPGIVSYAVDKLEERLTPGILNKISIEDYNRFKRDFSHLVDGEYLTKGQAVFRIVRTDKLYLLVKTEAEEANRYRINEKVFIRPIDLNKGLIDGRIIGTRIGENEGLLIISLNLFISEWLNMRHIDIEFIKNIYRGIIIPTSAVFTQPEGQGVLVYNSDGSYTFKKVKIIEEADNKVVVEGVEIGDSIIANPEAVDYGRGV